mgnify:CR=1 FL=1
MKKWLSVLLAAVMLLAMAGVAGAEGSGTTYPTPKGTITVTNLEKGEIVKIYQVIQLQLDAPATFAEPAWVTGLQSWIDEKYPQYDKPTKLPAAGDGKFLNALSGQLKNATPDDSKQMSEAGDYVSEELPVGSYIVIVMGGVKAHEAYLTSINAANYDYEGKKWNVTGGTVDASKKTKEPNVTKEISKETAAVGEVITFDIKTDIPSYPASVYDTVVYKIFDEMDEALTFNFDSLEVYGVKTDEQGNDVETLLTLGNDKKENGVDYEVEEPRTNVNGKIKIFELDFNYGKIKDYEKIHVQYKATVNEKIKLGSDENNNKVGFTYDVTTKYDEKKLHSFGLDLTKYEKGNLGTKLENAEFELSKLNKEKNAYEKLSFGKITEENGSYYYVPDAAGTDALTTDGNGKILVKGLDVGKYKLKETKAPQGYNLMVNEPEITLAQSNTKMYLSNTNDPEVEQSAYFYQPVEDSKISILPSTGGMGTTIFMVAGIGVMACAVVALMLVLKRQKHSEG